MKTVMFALSFLMISPAFATLSASYKCTTGTTNKAVLNIVDTKYAEPRLDFFPKGNSHTDNSRSRYSAYVSKLKATDNAKMPKYLMIKKGANFGAMKTVSTVYISPNVLQSAKKVHVVEVKKMISLRGNVMNSNVNSFDCILK